jgi:hypothetical protein
VDEFVFTTKGSVFLKKIQKALFGYPNLGLVWPRSTGGAGAEAGRVAFFKLRRLLLLAMQNSSPSPI